MRTDQLVKALAADDLRQASLWTAFAWAGAVGFAAGAVLFAMALGPRPDIAAAVAAPRFLMKFVVTLAVAISAGGLLWRLVRPGASGGWWAAAIAAGPALLASAIGVELFTVSADAWWGRLVGRNNIVCLVSIPLLAAPLLAALLAAARRGAPTRPGLAGAVAGLLAGGLGATLYAAHCIDDSPLFVAAWYAPAIALVAGIGAAAGARLLRW